MANNYQGYLISINNNIIPLSFMIMDSWTSTPDQETDIDSDVDLDGGLHRNVLPHTRTKIEFDTVDLHLDDKIALQVILPTTTTSRVSTNIKYWNENTNSYVDARVYMTPIEFKIKDASGTDIIYQPLHFTFIEY